ncbi:hypothetical protein [Haloferula rosea]|uniref:Uncharacterized protein n=1 Tax=Haloferula rosea TaxID=490093 RepID=A0A934VDW6_9BACT|nr:hypothetical protein [Haloferula rosea]MBK1826699.1 hypothetical protein [Haloferula rosea]
MGKKRILIQAAILLAVAWAVVIGVRAVAGSQRITAEKISQTIAEADFGDWSTGVPAGASLEDREDQLLEIVDMINRLDFAERERTRDNRTGEEFFRKLAPAEKDRFVKLTVAKTMETMLRALDGMPPEERKKIVEDGLRDIESGRTAEEMSRTRELSDELLNQITSEGMKAYFEETSAETKLDLAPLMEAMDGVVKGLRAHDFGPPQ